MIFMDFGDFLDIVLSFFNVYFFRFFLQIREFGNINFASGRSIRESPTVLWIPDATGVGRGMRMDIRRR